jgi:hypothetical protein
MAFVDVIVVDKKRMRRRTLEGYRTTKHAYYCICAWSSGFAMWTVY